MNEQEDADRFSEDLDALLEGREPARQDPALEAARRLARTDFAAESRVRSSLRERLLKDGAPAPRLSLRLAAAAACLLLALGLGVGRTLRRPAPAPAPRPLPVMPARIEARAGAVHETPFRSLPGTAVFATAPARETREDGTRLFVWELEGGSIALETRRITLEDLFQTPSL